MTSLSLSVYFLITKAVAQVFNGPGLEGGVIEAGMIAGPVRAPLREIVLSFLHTALGFLALAAIVMIVISGFTLVFSAGSDTVKDTAKKMILYVALGLIVVLFARMGVGFFLNRLP